MKCLGMFADCGEVTIYSDYWGSVELLHHAADHVVHVSVSQ